MGARPILLIWSAWLLADSTAKRLKLNQQHFIIDLSQFILVLCRIKQCPHFYQHTADSLHPSLRLQLCYKVLFD
jgi:hypothetical protein